MRLKRLANGRWQVRWRDDAGVQRSRNFEQRMDAQDHLRRLDRGDVPPPEPPRGETGFAAFAAIWLVRYSKAETAPASHLKAERTILNHLAPAFMRFRLSELRRSHLLDLRSVLLAKGLANKTVNDIETTAKTIMSVAADWDYVTASPWTGMKKLKVPKKSFGFWTAAERDRFVTWCRTRDPAFAELVTVATWTGLRRGELQALEVQQLDFDQRMIRVDATWSDHLQLRLDQTKNGEIGWVPMSNAVWEALKTRLPAQGTTTPVFDPRLFRDAYWRLRRRARDCGVKEIRFHDLRHTAASIWVMAGKPLYTVQKLMRHKSIAMTERYAHLSPDYLKGAAEIGECTESALPPKSRRNTRKSLATPERLEVLKLTPKTRGKSRA